MDESAPADNQSRAGTRSGRSLADAEHRPATIYDIAERAGVSAATVSRVMTGRTRVQPGVAQRVRDIAQELGYQPNRVARRLREKAAHVVTLILSDIENPFFTAVARGVEDAVHARGLSLILCNSDESLDKERRYLAVALAEQSAGVILSPASSRDTDISVLLTRRIPVIAIERKLPRYAVDTVLVDNHNGATRATEHLLEAGYRRIACLTGPRHMTTANERLAGYKNALRRAGHEIIPALIGREDLKVDGGHEAMLSLLDLTTPPDAVLVSNNLAALGALEALRERGRAVPDEFGIVAFDEAPWTKLLDPALTTIEQPTYEIGTTAANLLADRLAGYEGAPREIRLRTTMHPRASSRGPATLKSGWSRAVR